MKKNKMKKRGMGRVFISYSHKDRRWLSRLQVHLKPLEQQGLVELWDDTRIATGAIWKSEIEQAIATAQVAVLLISADFLASDFILADELPPLLLSAASAGVVIMPVILSPCRFNETASLSRFQAVNPASQPLKGMTRAKQDDVLYKLSVNIEAAMRSGAASRAAAHSDSERDFVVDRSQHIVSELRQATVQLRSVGELLASHSVPGSDLRGVLEEVGKTYGAVSSAVSEFVAPAIGTGPIDGRPFLAMERGTLRMTIENGRGHCEHIFHYYCRAGGIRDSVQLKSPSDFQQVDAAFQRLLKGDQDLFTPLVEIGRVLATESRVVVDLLISGQEQAARQRIRDGRAKLAPFEDQLSTAMTELQQAEAALGYVGPSG